jgi:hypothetical protein
MITQRRVASLTLTKLTLCALYFHGSASKAQPLLIPGDRGLEEQTEPIECRNHLFFHDSRVDRTLISNYYESSVDIRERQNPALPLHHREAKSFFSPVLYGPTNWVFWGYTSERPDRGDMVMDMSVYQLTQDDQPINNPNNLPLGNYYDDTQTLHWRFLTHQSNGRHFMEDVDQENMNYRFPLDHHIALVLPPPPIEMYRSLQTMLEFMMLNQLGVLAYLRETTDEATRFFIVDYQYPTPWGDDSRVSPRELIEKFDPGFSSRIDWISCEAAESNDGHFICNQMVHLRFKATLQFMYPPFVSDDAQLFQLIRDWINAVYPSDPPQGEIVYIMDDEEAIFDGFLERMTIRRISDISARFGKNVTVFDANSEHDLFDQIKLFQSASVVIGAHGPALVNFLFLTTLYASCDDRTKILELIPESNEIRANATYYGTFLTCPWAEYHQMYLPSDDSHYWQNLRFSLMSVLRS